jgi:hypothetical protein
MFALRLVLVVLAVSTGVLIAEAQGPSAQKAAVDWVVSVILPEAQPIDSTRLAAAIRKRATKQDRFTGVESDKGIVLLRIGGGTAMLSLMEAPIPGQELERVCSSAWYWREACDTVKDHKAHLLVILMGTRMGKAESAVLHTKIVAALFEESNAVAAYWGVSLNSRKAFLEQSANMAPNRMPTALWVSYRVSRDASGRISLSTDGLKGFDLMEIEVKDAAVPLKDVYGLVEGVAAYLITKGAVIRDGDTVGHTNDQRILMHHGESYWRPGTRVYRMEYNR